MSENRMRPPQEWDVVINNWLEYLSVAGQSAATVHTRRCKMIRLAKLMGVDPYHVSTDDLVDAMAGHNWKSETLKAYRNTARSFFTWMVLSNHRTDDPSMDLPKVRKAYPKPRPCPDEYIRYALCKATPTERFMIRLAAECGLRRAEIAAVHSNDVIQDSIGYSLTVHGKGSKDRIVPLPDDLALQILLTRGYLFPGRWSGHVEESYIGRHVSSLLPDGYAAHTLRHRFATTVWAATHDLLLVSHLLGHASVETTQNYVAMPDSRLRAAMDAVHIIY
ncbi:MAG: tyrosine-type recombinase/integrase [Scardovia wiggsiae]|uniref:tyrosine-type recombinase/integrase n=2 Tax=Scardovia wiggsiae TaxID=230143 RepID=UPI001CB0CA27|nr:tyrosine-type recombinase/integrase [Scardovia wiggsiae]